MLHVRWSKFVNSHFLFNMINTFDNSHNEFISALQMKAETSIYDIRTNFCTKWTLHAFCGNVVKQRVWRNYITIRYVTLAAELIPLTIWSFLLYYLLGIWIFCLNPVHGLYSLRRRRLTGIWIPMINLRRSDDRLRFIMGIPILIRRRSVVDIWSELWLLMAWYQGISSCAEYPQMRFQGPLLLTWFNFNPSRNK